MEIDAKPGTKVKYTGDVSQTQINWGSHTDPRKILVPDKIYTIDRTEIHSYHTKVFLEECPGYSFNSVWFDEI